MSLEGSPNNQVSQNVVDSIPKSIRKILAAVGLSIEVLLKASLASGVAITAFSPGPVIQKVESGLTAPGKIYDYLSSVPKDIENIQNLRRLLDAPWSFTKIRDLFSLGKIEIERIYNSEKERIDYLLQGYDNISNIPVQTLISMLIVVVIYSTLIGFFQIMRLGTSDTIPTQLRKKIARAIGLDTFFVDLTDKQLQELLDGLKNEIERRNNDL